jgi:hypothetical protein
MNRMQEAKMVPPIFIGRWTPEGHRCRVFLDPTGKDTHRYSEVCAAGRDDMAGTSVLTNFF